MVFSVTEAELLAKEVSTSGGRFINPSKIDGEIRVRLFGEGVTGFEGWTNDSKPIRWESRPAELPENIRKSDDGKDPLKRFVAAIAWEYDSSSFKIISLTQKSLIKELMGRSTEQGMQTFDQALIEAYKSGLISHADAIRHADSANDVRLNIKLHEHGAESLSESTDFEVE